MLTLQIDGRWEPEDFIEVLTAVESIYYKVAVARRYSFDRGFYWFEDRAAFSSYEEHLDAVNRWILTRSRDVAPQYLRLQVARIQYASPGGIDLVGLGEACKAVEGIVDRLLKFFTERTLRRERDRRSQIATEIKGVEHEKEIENLRGLKIRNAREILELRRDFPEVPDELFVALLNRDQEKLIPRIAEGKLIGVTRVDGVREKPEGSDA